MQCDVLQRVYLELSYKSPTQRQLHKFVSEQMAQFIYKLCTEHRAHGSYDDINRLSFHWSEKMQYADNVKVMRAVRMFVINKINI